MGARRRLVCKCANRSFPERNADHQRFLVHHIPILNLSLPCRIVDPRSLREPEAPQQGAEQHPHLHQRQVFTDAHCRTVREGHESGRAVFSRWRALVQPSLRQERPGRMEVTGVPMDAVGVKEELRLLRDHPAHRRQQVCQNYLGVRKGCRYRFPRILGPFPLFTDRCEPLGTGGWRRSASLLLKT